VLNASLTELAGALKQKKISSAELTRAHLERVGRLNRELNAFITVNEEGALAQARQADARIARGDAGPLTGIPVAAHNSKLPEETVIAGEPCRSP